MAYVDTPIILVEVSGFYLQDGTRTVRGPELVIGRGRDADVMLDVSQLAERHLKIIAVDGNFEVHDLTGRHSVRTIRPGDLIRLFGITLSFKTWTPRLELGPPTESPQAPVRVADLLQHPSSFHNRRITATGLWWYGFESSSFAGAWFDCPEEWESVADGRRYVRVTGTWYATPGGQYGHCGGSKQKLAAERIEILPLVPTIELGPGELAARRASLDGELVGATVPLRLGHRLATLDGIPTSFQFEKTVGDPIELRVRAIIWIERGTLTVLEHTRLSEPRTVDVPEVAAEALRAHTNTIVDVVGDLVAGRYWPRIGGLELVPPEITTTDRAAQEFCTQTPPPEEVLRWRERLAGGPIRIRARGHVDERRFSVYRLNIGAAPWPEDDIPDWAR